MLTVYMGHDPAEQLAYDVACHSIHENWPDASIYPLRLPELMQRGLLSRPTYSTNGQLWDVLSDAPMSTEFAISRFLVPIIHQGRWALFMDCDMVVHVDLRSILAQIEPGKAVYCVKHKHDPQERDKMCGKLQTAYARKNWSSFMLFDCEHPAHKRLRLEDVNRWPGRNLHAFDWLMDDEIGELFEGWNWLVGAQDMPQPCKVSHFTCGGPWFTDWQGGEFDAIWTSAHEAYQQSKALRYAAPLPKTSSA